MSVYSEVLWIKISDSINEIALMFPSSNSPTDMGNPILGQTKPISINKKKAL
jgi:hypothetical protein